MGIADYHKDYDKLTLDEADAHPDPFRQFERWFERMLELDEVKALEAIAAMLCTVGADGQPSGRIVLLKEFNDQGFTFFTNYQSDKAVQLASNPRAAMTFWWPSVERQVRIEGTTAKILRADSQTYFALRPRDSQLGAWASRQSAAIVGRASLEAELETQRAKFEGKPVPCPEDWGGYLLTPARFEFWQGRPSRLHDRLRYTRQQDHSWRIERLSP